MRLVVRLTTKALLRPWRRPVKPTFFNDQLKHMEYVILAITEMEAANPTRRRKMFILE